MAMGPVNVPAGSGAEGSIPIDEGSTVVIKIGCDEKGVYIVTPDEATQGGAE